MKAAAIVHHRIVGIFFLLFQNVHFPEEVQRLVIICGDVLRLHDKILALAARERDYRLGCKSSCFSLLRDERNSVDFYFFGCQ